MKPYLIAYATNEGVALFTKEDVQRLSHINLAFGHVRKGLLDTSGLSIFDQLDKLRSWNPGLKIVLSVGGWTAGGFSEMAMTQDGRRAFGDSVERAMDSHRLDGIDIDWEYPCSSAAGIASDPRDKENFTHLMQQMRQAAGERIVSIAAGASPYFVRDTQMDLVGQICDYVMLMTYDLRSGFTRQAGHHTGLYQTAGDAHGMTVERSVNLFLQAGVPREKLVIGAAFYSRKWDQVKAGQMGMLQPAGSVGNYGPGYAQLLREYINKNGWLRHWDEQAKAPWLWKEERGQGSFISYDDPQSLAHKCKYLLDQGLAGIMYWEHSCDDTHTLLAALHQGLHQGGENHV